MTWLQVPGYAVVAFRIMQLGLTTDFPWFFALCITESLRILISAMIPGRSTVYGYYYVGSEAIIWVLYLLATLEIFRNAFSGHKGLYNFSKKAIGYCLGASLLIAAATAGLDFSSSEARYPVLEAFLVLDRTGTLSLLVFLIALRLMLSWYPVKLSRNVVLHTVLFTFFFAAKAALLFTRNLFGTSFTAAGNIGLKTVDLFCLALWSVLLVSTERDKVVRSSVPHSKENEERLLAQLDLLNNTLAGTLRK